MYNKLNNSIMTERNSRRWTHEEDQVLLRYIKANPTNLHKCFMMVSEHLTEAGTPRTVSGVQAHWYTVLSKSNNDNALCFFTASAKHVSKNRKNGTGIESNPSIWRRLITILRSLTH